MSSTAQSRYGRRQLPRWFWPAFATVAIGLGVAWAAWVAFDEPAVSAEVYGYEVVDENRTVVTIDIHRPDPVDISCTVQAQALDHSVVGERTVELPATKQRSERLEIDVETEREAITGVLRTCHTH
ncbi:DUF4307 domain-containing protein [Aeromicrobium sp. CTD01-1L150]|uniref:DUF4307 domain-containing protein n=1 Tax=Aeromicrobium sp. CTD01-1L150 TaxID=3341830 RepID=UPI0035C0666B